MLRVIARDGVKGADLRSVANEAGCSTGVIAHYVGDKQALLLGALREAMSHVARGMADVAARQSGMARLIAMLEAGMPLDPERAASCRIFYHFAAEGMNDPKLAGELASYYDWWRREVGDVIEELQVEGHFALQNPSALAETMVGLAEGLAIQGVFAADQTQTERLSGRLADAVARFDAPLFRREQMA
ncbi:TetR/AcrR family transcriptional regulator [Novosphingobium sp. B 225]|uniref:TetR/AcrR family transcriptional regulator n=1 Tax=Novosphingobium sp. B 225 TaxID=1961849 RepID=UPI0015959B6B|nr:TetR/AcrR family transcriptional regulator [Novosphingobium sp. B 225]